MKLIFQPAEEGPPAGEDGGAELMVKEGVLENPKVDAIFGLHVFPLSRRHDRLPAGSADGERAIRSRSRSRDGRRTAPCRGAASIRSSSARRSSWRCRRSSAARVNITEAPAVVTVGAFNGGIRFNIVPEDVELAGHDSRVRRGRPQGHPSARSRHRDATSPRARAARRRSTYRPRLSGDASTTRRSPSAWCRRCGAWPAPRTCASAR